MSQLPGVCPACEGEGPVGQGCEQKGCANQRLHFVPRPYLEQARASKGRGATEGLGRFIGDYLVVGHIGAGGFGAVLLGLQRPRFLLKAAVKLMHGGAVDPALASVLMEKFQNEGDALAMLNHPNIVRLLKYGIDEGTPFLVMEYVEGGRTLRDEVRRLAGRGAELPVDLVRRILLQTANGLGSAHAQSIIHRDIKPDNLMLQEVEGDPYFVRILDFGLAKVVESSTQTSIAMGTPVYMAPEQIDRAHIGPWTDIYSVGAVAFELLTGRRPFPGRTLQEILSHKLDPAFEPTNQLGDLSLPAPMIRFLAQALARKPEDRIPNAKAFRDAVESVFSQRKGRAGRFSGVDLSGILDSTDLRYLVAARRNGSLPPPEGPDATRRVAQLEQVLERSLAPTEDRPVPSGVNPGSGSGTFTGPTSVDPPKRGRWWPIAGGFVGLALVVGVVLALAVGRGQGAGTTTPDGGSTAPVTVVEASAGSTPLAALTSTDASEGAVQPEPAAANDVSSGPSPASEPGPPDGGSAPAPADGAPASGLTWTLDTASPPREEAKPRDVLFSTEISPGATESGTPAASDVGRAGEAEEEAVLVRIESTPTHATVREGQTVLGKTPLSIPVAPDASREVLLVRRGHRPQAVTLDARQAGTVLQVRMRPARARRPTSPPDKEGGVQIRLH